MEMREAGIGRVKTFGIAVGLVAFLLSAPVAQATYDPIESGTTKLRLDKGFLASLKKVGVQVTAKSSAKRKGSVLILPIVGGKSDPTIKKAEIEQEGTIVFQAGNRKVPLRSIELKAKHTPLFAKVGGSQLKVASSKTTKVARAGFATSFSAKGLELTQKVATRLNKKLRTKDFFKEGQLIGTIQSEAQPQRVTILPQGQATITPDAAILAKFKSLFVSLNPISPAELSPGPVLRFPIALGGQIAPDASEGTLRLGGAIELLQLGAGQVFQKEYWLDLAGKDTSSEVDVEPTPAFPGKLGRIGTYAIGMTGAAVASDPKSRAISVSGALLTLDAQTAQTFNDAFAAGKPTFATGEVFGTASFGAVAQ
ncbi:MAG: hypothetical protein QOF13_2162 [Solirubrobacterales bacterium]|jgi:hypothetical protein|nr:hypothetical protein [Solirubrobacterales bacterium]